jgi:hypothetical protein
MIAAFKARLVQTKRWRSSAGARRPRSPASRRMALAAAAAQVVQR